MFVCTHRYTCIKNVYILVWDSECQTDQWISKLVSNTCSKVQF